MRRLGDELAILAAPRLVLAAVRDDMLGIPLGRARQFPLFAAGNAAPPRPRRPAAATRAMTSSG